MDDRQERQRALDGIAGASGATLHEVDIHPSPSHPPFFGFLIFPREVRAGAIDGSSSQTSIVVPPPRL